MAIQPGDTVVACGNGYLEMMVSLQPYQVPIELFGDGKVIGVTYKLLPVWGGEPRSARTQYVEREFIEAAEGPIQLLDPFTYPDDAPIIDPGLYMPVIEFVVAGSAGDTVYPNGYAVPPLAVFDDEQFASGLDGAPWSLKSLTSVSPANASFDHIVHLATIMNSSPDLVNRLHYV